MGHAILQRQAQGYFERCTHLIGNDESFFQVREHLAVIADEESVGHVGQLLGVLVRQLQRTGHLVGDQVVHERRARGARVPEPHSLVEHIKQGHQPNYRMGYVRRLERARKGA